LFFAIFAILERTFLPFKERLGHFFAVFTSKKWKMEKWYKFAKIWL